MFEENIRHTNLALDYHRGKAKLFFRLAWVFSILSFLAIIIFAIYADFMLKTVAQIYLHSSAQAANVPLKDVQSPDFVGIINENYFGYWSSAGFFLVILASIGMLKYHANRTTHFENSLNQLYKLNSASLVEGIQFDLASKLIDSCLISHEDANTKASLNPILDKITENTTKILDKVGAK